MADLSGQKIGKYQLIERLGRGGMADVYKALQPNLDRMVAIKVIHEHMSDSDEFVARFQREARVVAQLRHPHILQVIDFDSEGDSYYMVMEYIQGQTLKDVIIENGPFNPEDALRVLEQMADALAFAHQSNMIHRDIKPANIMFTDDTHSDAVLTDFGIARLLDSTELTSSGMMIGTPMYISPEAGQGNPVDGRSDLYSLGVVFYEMLTGDVPFNADTPLAIVIKHISAPLPPLSSLGIEVHPTVEQILLRLLMKDPEDRYDSAEDLREAVKLARRDLKQGNKTRPSAQNRTKYAANKPSKPKRTPTMPSPIQSNPSNLKWYALIGALSLAILATFGGVVALALNEFNEPETNEPSSEFVAANADVALPQDGAPPATREAPPPTRQPALGGGAGSQRQAAMEYYNDTLLLTDDGLFEDALRAITRAVNLDPLNPLFLEQRGWLYLELDQPESAVRDFRAAIERDEQQWKFRYGMAVALEELGDFEGAEAAYYVVVELKPNEEEAYFRLGILHFNQGELREAVQNFNRTLEFDPTYADAFYFLGLIALERGNTEEAIPLLEQAVDLEPENAEYWFLLGEAQYTLGSREDALVAYQQHVEIKGEDADPLAVERVEELQ